jgi:uncharacterized membrane protein YgcG
VTRIILVVIFFLSIFFPLHVAAVNTTTNQYVIENFSSDIVVEKDTSLTVTETIKVDFPNPRHGIFRIIPVVYSVHGKTIKAQLDVISITDGNETPYQFERSRLKQSVKLKIGDPLRYVTGVKTYIIKYRISKVLQRFEEHEEVYWNVTGSEWDTDILASNASVSSPFARITDLECFAGTFGGTEKFCKFESHEDKAYFESTTTLGEGRDFSIVIALDKENDLQFPSFLQRLSDYVFDNWGYLAASIPLIIMFYLWFKKGRDLRFVSENIYFKPEDVSTKTVSLFKRKHIPFVYHPIDNLSPSEVGTVIDERVHISDVVAEILELARLKFITIRRIKKKKLIGEKIDYAFIKTGKYNDEQERSKLKDYQDYLLKKLFTTSITSKSKKELKKLIDGDKKVSQMSFLEKNEYVLLSGIKNHFYKVLPEFKNKLYKRMGDEKLFDKDPEKVRLMWFGIFIAIEFLFAFFVIVFTVSTFNFGPMIVMGLFSLPGFIFAISMPRRTAKGYSYFRQIEGLKWYLNKGKWRHEVAEKQLFLGEVLPLAIALGVVERITDDMKELGIKPPSYFIGSTSRSFSNDFSKFYSSSTSSLMSAPGGGWSGSSSWSGGSGFSGGGSSGGGFGGGGGGSW